MLPHTTRASRWSSRNETGSEAGGGAGSGAKRGTPTRAPPSQPAKKSPATNLATNWLSSDESDNGSAYYPDPNDSEDGAGSFDGFDDASSASGASKHSDVASRPQSGRAYERARKADAAADARGAGDNDADSNDGSGDDSDDGSDDGSGDGNRAAFVKAMLQTSRATLKVLKSLDKKLDNGPNAAGAPPAPPPAPGPAPGPVPPPADDKFTPTLGQKTFGAWRAPVFLAQKKVTILNIANELEYADMVTPTLQALKWTGAGYSPISLRPFKTATQNIRREVHSSITTDFRDGYMLREPNLVYRIMPNAKQSPELARAAKTEHVPLFEKYAGPLGPGFTLDGDNKFMFYFHASRGTGVNAGRAVACGNSTVRAPVTRKPWEPHLALISLALVWPQFTDGIQDLAMSFPPGRYRTITIELIAACIAFGKAMFTFTFAGEENEPRTIDNLAYGTWDKRFYSSTYIQEVIAWLLDEDAVPTEWDVLLNIREQMR